MGKELCKKPNVFTISMNIKKKEKEKERKSWGYEQINSSPKLKLEMRDKIENE